MDLGRLKADASSTIQPRSGIWAAVGASFLWGVLAIYRKQLEEVPAVEVIAHRVFRSFWFLLAILPFRGWMRQFLSALRNPRVAALYLVSGLLLTVNWLTFFHAVQQRRIVDASLGYFLNPLFSIALGALVLQERLRSVQWMAVAFAAAGVLVQLALLGSLPWVSLVLATTFAFYGLLRKQGSLGALTGQALETALIAPFAAAYLAWMSSRGEGVLGNSGWETHGWVASTGIVTANPLVLFATAARTLPLTTIGLCQYLAPSLQLAVGTLLYAEAFGAGRLLAFAFIWAGLAIYTVDGVRRGRI